jgi:nucleoside-diphosphate-sugar epimerase
MMRRVPSIDKLQSLTGFRPQTTLNEIIDRVSAYYQQIELTHSNVGIAKRTIA